MNILKTMESFWWSIRQPLDASSGHSKLLCKPITQARNFHLGNIRIYIHIYIFLCICKREDILKLYKIQVCFNTPFCWLKYFYRSGCWWKGAIWCSRLWVNSRREQDKMTESPGHCLLYRKIRTWKENNISTRIPLMVLEVLDVPNYSLSNLICVQG